MVCPAPLPNSANGLAPVPPGRSESGRSETSSVAILVATVATVAGVSRAGGREKGSRAPGGVDGGRWPATLGEWEARVLQPRVKRAELGLL